MIRDSALLAAIVRVAPGRSQNSRGLRADLEAVHGRSPRPRPRGPGGPSVRQAPGSHRAAGLKTPPVDITAYPADPFDYQEHAIDLAALLVQSCRMGTVAPRPVWDQCIILPNGPWYSLLLQPGQQVGVDDVACVVGMPCG